MYKGHVDQVFGLPSTHMIAQQSILHNNFDWWCLFYALGLEVLILTF